MVIKKNLIQRYQDLVDENIISQDYNQKKTLEMLASLTDKLSIQTKSSWSSSLTHFIKKSEPPTIKGIYIWGGVGRGKSMLMDLFFENIDFKNKKRTHFHNFMADTHDLIHKLRKNNKIENVPDHAAGIISKTIKLLCFDEMELRDIADAMVLNRLFQGLWNRGVVIVATSNRPPSKLYEKGLHRERVIPFINQLKIKCEVTEIKGNEDFRLSVRKGMNGWFYPLSNKNTDVLNKDFDQLKGTAISKVDYVPSAGRQIYIPKSASGVAFLKFVDLCGKPLAARDFIEVSNRYRGLIIDKIPTLNDLNRNESRRFMWLIDALYDANRFLICCAETPIRELYNGNDWKFEFERTTSRLIELTASPENIDR